MNRLHPAICLVTLLGGPTLAQSDPVSPVGIALAEAPATNPNPFGVPEALSHYMQIHEDLPPQAMTIQGLAFRRNSSADSVPAYDVDLDLRLALPITTAAAPDATFAANYLSRTSSLVVARRIVNFPGSGPSTSLPQPFDYVIAFDSPNLLSGGSVLWEVQIHGRTNTTLVEFDQLAPGTGNANPFPSSLRFGTGCMATGGTAPFITQGSNTMNWAAGTAQLRFVAHNGPANRIGILALGFVSSQWSGLPLPIEVPGSGAGPSGSCWIHNDLFTTIAAPIGPTGAFATFVNVPLFPGLGGVALYHHVWALDPAANAFGIVTSDALGRQIVEPFTTPAVSLIGSRGSLGATGIVNTGGGLVTRFVQ